MSSTVDAAASAATEMTKTLFERILDGNPNAFPALLFILMVFFLLTIALLIYLAQSYFKTEMQSYKLQIKDAREALREAERNTISYRDKTQEKFEEVIAKYHEDRQNAFITLSSVKEMIAQLLGLVSRNNFTKS